MSYLKENVPFNIAMESLKQGKMITRRKWDTKKVVFQQIPVQISEEFIPEMHSLPPNVKQELLQRGGYTRFKMGFLELNSDNTICTWVASTEDIFSTDWFVLN